MRILITLLILLMPVTAAAQTAVVEQGWYGRGINWSNSKRSIIRFSVTNQEGSALVCVAIASTPGMPSNANIAILREASIAGADGKRLIRGLSFAARTSSRALNSHLVGIEANCRLARNPYPASGGPFKIELPRRVNFDR